MSDSTLEDPPPEDPPDGQPDAPPDFGAGGIVIPPPVEAWIPYPTTPPPQDHPMIVNALSDDGCWTGVNIGYQWWQYKRDQKIAEMILAVIMDYREAYGAAFDEIAQEDATLVPTACISHMDNTVQYNIALRYDLYTLKADGITRVPVKNYFEPAWKDAAVYCRHVASLHKIYRNELAIQAQSDGTPVYIPSIENAEVCL